jgi:ATP-dependent RNA helicase RhlE
LVVGSLISFPKRKMKSFSELTLSPILQANLLKNGFTQPTPVQELAIEPALAGRNVVATAQTGTGKTLAFVLPLVQSLLADRTTKGVRAVILSPTRELAIQIQESFTKIAHGTGIRAAIVVGGVGENPQLQSIRKGAQVVVATPGRLYDFLSRQLVSLNAVQILVLDEADRMLDMGFLPTIKRIMSSTPANRQTLFFSATIETSVRHLVETHVPNAVRVEVGSSTRPVEQVDLRLYEIDANQKLPLLESMLQTETGSFLVFARTKHGADRLAKQISRTAKTATIHGDRSQNQRNQALKGFQDGYYRVLVATDVAARGIHVEGISHVVNYDLPQVPEDFIHRVGRTGRAGARGTASTFATRMERSEISRIERALTVRMVRHLAPKEIVGDNQTMAPVVEIAGAMRFERTPQQRTGGKMVFSSRNRRSVRRAI